MADNTGAPHFIPYVEPTDLVREYPAADEASAFAVAAALDVAGNAGIGSNVVQAVKTDAFSSAVTTYVDVTGLSVTITPSSDSSKVLVIAQVSLANALNANYVRLVGPGGADAFIGDAAGSRERAVHYETERFGRANNYLVRVNPVTIVFLSSPATTTAVTYKIIARCTSDNVHINRSRDDSDAGTVGRTVSSITAIEVAA